MYRKAFLDEIKRCSQLGLTKYNFHPGSTRGKISIEEGCKLVAKAIDEAHTQTPDVNIIVEITAGGGSLLGSKFEEVKKIIDFVKDKSRIGVCFDTVKLVVVICIIVHFYKL